MVICEPDCTAIIHSVNTQEILSSILAGNGFAIAGLQDLPENDWMDLLKLASTLGVTPLLYRQMVLRTPDLSVPVSVTDKLRDAYFRCHAANARLFHELASVLDGFQQEAIPVILLKGAFLADSVYQDAGLRPMGDMDIMVRKESAVRGIEVLEAAGYKPYQDFSPEVELKLAKHMPPMQKNGIVIELHWDVTSPESSIRVDIPALWTRAVPFEKENIRALALCPEDVLLHLCIHAAHHYFFEQLRSLCDIREVAVFYGGELDWDKIVARAESWHADRGVYLALHLARDLLDSGVPEMVLESLQPRDISTEVVAWARERVFQTDPVLSDNFIALMQGKHGMNRWQAFLGALVPSRIMMSRLYGIAPGSWRVYLKYPAHWINRIKRYRSSTVRMLHGEARIVENAKLQQRLMEWLDQ